MALFNYATKEITLKIVYYGPGLSGKTTNLQYLHSVLNPETKGKLLSLSTEADRTLFFDFLPVELGKIRDFSIRFQLYTVPGQVRYNATRKVVLKGADAVVFVADSQSMMREQNIESLANMRENLSSNNIDPDDIPIVLQYNKRDLRNIATVENLQTDLNSLNYPVIESSALDGAGVEETFKLVTKLLIKDIAKKHNIGIGVQQETKKMPERPTLETTPVGTTAQTPAYSSAIIAPEEEKQPAVHKTDKEPSTIAEAPSYSSAIIAPEEEKQPAVHKADKEPSAAAEAPFYSSAIITPEEEMQPAAHKADREFSATAESAPPVGQIPVGKIDLLVDEIVKMHGILIELKNSMSLVTGELNTLKGMREEQRALFSRLREMEYLIRDLEEKKRRKWFRF